LVTADKLGNPDIGKSDIVFLYVIIILEPSSCNK